MAFHIICILCLVQQGVTSLEEPLPVPSLFGCKSSTSLTFTWRPEGHYSRFRGNLYIYFLEEFPFRSKNFGCIKMYSSPNRITFPLCVLLKIYSGELKDGSWAQICTPFGLNHILTEMYNSCFHIYIPAPLPSYYYM